MNIPDHWGKPTPGSSVHVILDWVDKKVQVNEKLVKERNEMLEYIDEKEQEIKQEKQEKQGLKVYKEVVSKEIIRIQIREPNVGETGHDYKRYIKGQVDQIINRQNQPNQPINIESDWKYHALKLASELGENALFSLRNELG
jgi:hypothetical protein